MEASVSVGRTTRVDRPRRVHGPRRRHLRAVGKYLLVALLMVLYLAPMLTVVNTALKTPMGFLTNYTGLHAHV